MVSQYMAWASNNVMAALGSGLITVLVTGVLLSRLWDTVNKINSWGQLALRVGALLLLALALLKTSSMISAGVNDAVGAAQQTVGVTGQTLTDASAVMESWFSTPPGASGTYVTGGVAPVVVPVVAPKVAPGSSPSGNTVVTVNNPAASTASTVGDPDIWSAVRMPAQRVVVPVQTQSIVVDPYAPARNAEEAAAKKQEAWEAKAKTLGGWAAP